MIMPWGNFKDQDIKSIPSDYLKWIIENVNNKKSFSYINYNPKDILRNRAVCRAADKEYQYREKNNCHIE